MHCAAVGSSFVCACHLSVKTRPDTLSPSKGADLGGRASSPWDLGSVKYSTRAAESTPVWVRGSTKSQPAQDGKLAAFVVVVIEQIPRDRARARTAVVGQSAWSKPCTGHRNIIGRTELN